MTDKILYSIWLAGRYPAGSTVPRRLLEAFGSAEGVYDAKKADYDAAGFRAGESNPVCAKSPDSAKRILDFCQREHIEAVGYAEAFYPSLFYDLANPPAVIFFRGKMPDFASIVTVTMVGTRSMSRDGGRAAHKLSYETAASGGVVVSGFAAGIDSACHRGALDAGGFTVAVLGCGVDVVYPQENFELYDKIVQNGVIMSEHMPSTPPDGGNFPVRNRLLSALGRAVVVVEAPVGSGAMITANYAVEQGRALYAVPGSAVNPAAEGSNFLLKNGVAPATDAFDILEEFEMLYPERINISTIKTKQYAPPAELVRAPARQQAPEDDFPSGELTDRSAELDGLRREIYREVLSSHLTTAEALITGRRTLGDVLYTLTSLEVGGYVEALPGGLYAVKRES